MSRLILVLGDQLSLSLSSLRQRLDDDCVLMAEVHQEAEAFKSHLMVALTAFARSKKTVIVAGSFIYGDVLELTGEFVRFFESNETREGGK